MNSIPKLTLLVLFLLAGIGLSVTSFLRVSEGHGTSPLVESFEVEAGWDGEEGVRERMHPRAKLDSQDSRRMRVGTRVSPRRARVRTPLLGFSS